MRMTSFVKCGLTALVLTTSTLAFAQFRPPGAVSCDTSSNGYNFSSMSLDRRVAIDEATRQCRAHPTTTNVECDANIACSDEYPRQMVNCSTFSRGLQFNDQSRDESVARSEVARQCRANSSTSNQECDANVYCSYQGDPRDPRDPFPRDPRFPDPRDPRDPFPRDPRDPRFPDPRDPRDPFPRDPFPRDPFPRDPRDPRFPDPRFPRPRLESCTVGRFDPAGILIQNYSAEGLPGQACSYAISKCQQEVRGRQYCR